MSLEHTIRSMFIKEDVEPIAEDGHQDVASAKRQCKTIIEDAQAIMSALNSMDNEGSLPTWWTNKLAVASTDLNKMNDYISNPTEMKEESKVRCPRCGTMNDPSNDKCTNCGLELSKFDSYQKEDVDQDKLLKALKKKLSDEGGAAGMKPLKDVAKEMGVDLTPEMLKGMSGIKQHRDGDYILEDVEIEEMKVRGKEVYDKTFANRTQADNYAKKHGGRVQQVGRVFFVFKEEIEEARRNPSKSGGSGYDLYHKDFSSAMKHAYDYAKSKLGVEVDPKEIDDKVASGPRKPSKGKTNTYRLKGKDGKKAVQIQVANLDDKKFELNMYKEEVELELDENKNLIKDYQDMKATGKKDHNILDVLMSMPKYKRMSKDQMAKIIGDAKRKGIFKEDVELDEAKSKEQQIADLEKMLDRISGNTASVRMKKFALQKKIDKLKNEELEEAYKTPAEAGAYEAGKKAARAGKKYDDNPNKKGSKEYTAWSKGHNEARAKGMKEEVELTESPMVTFTVPNVTSDMASKLERTAKEKNIEYSRKGRTVVLKGKRIDMTMLRTKMGLAQTNIPMVPVKEEVELDEKKGEPPFDTSKADYKGAAKELTQYAMTKGGVDKKDFLGFANRMSAIASKASPRVTAKFARDLQDLDTDVREVVIRIMRNNGIKVTMAGRGLKIEGVGAELTATQRLRAILETEVPVTESKQPLTVGQSIMEKAIARIREAEGEKMTDAQLKRREEIAKDLPDDEFKKRYGDDWMQVKMATATKMAKGEK